MVGLNVARARSRSRERKARRRRPLLDDESRWLAWWGRNDQTDRFTRLQEIRERSFYPPLTGTPSVRREPEGRGREGGREEVVVVVVVVHVTSVSAVARAEDDTEGRVKRENLRNGRW